MLLTRQGLNASAKWTRRELRVLHDKIIIGLDDEKVQQMLRTKRARNNRADLIQQRIEDFRLRIWRRAHLERLTRTVRKNRAGES